MFHAALLAIAVANSEPVIVDNGVYVGESGLRIELVGITSSTNRRSAPIDALGKPLDAKGLKEFELYGQQKLADRPWTDRSDPNSVVLLAVFKIRGPKESTLGIHSQRPFRPRMEGYYQADPKKGRLVKAMVVEFSSPKDSAKVSIPLKHPGGAYREIAAFTPEGKCEDANFSFKVQTGSQEAVQITKGKTVKTVLDTYRGSALAPLEFQGQDFELAASDTPPQDPKDKSMFPLNMGGAYEVGTEGDKLKLEFFGSFVPQPGKERKLLLSARPQKSVTFRTVRPK